MLNTSHINYFFQKLDEKGNLKIFKKLDISEIDKWQGQFEKIELRLTDSTIV